ncbi:MAG: hypothetical protein K9K67_09925 [Bacteriovoracaceae bacterium]|nr:hypothetical protein [Bacteriovoracaceae bacterium]
MKKITFLLFISLIFQSDASEEKKDILNSIKLAQNWLLSQQTPNVVVEEPVRAGFILSYETPKVESGYKYIFSKSSIYDNALALIAFTMLGQKEGAKKIIDAVMKAAPTGKLYFNYNTHNAWPNELDQDGAIIRNGASTWFGYALAFYLKIRKKEDPSFLETKDGALYKNYLLKIAEKILLYKIKDKSLATFGLITGGHGKYKFEIKDGKVEEVFYDEKIKWVSVEHCIDLYFLLSELDKLGIKDFDKDLIRLKERIVSVFWNNETKQFNRGFSGGAPDLVEALDAASWGAMYLFSIGDIEKALIALKKTDAYTNSFDPIRGHRPYINVLINEDPQINQFFYPKNPKKTWNDLDLSWYEGTFGVNLARLKIKGVNNKIKELILNAIKIQKKNGSFIYSTKKIPFQFSNNPSVASTAWFIIFASSYLVPELGQEFWP